jgi:hypothetical protein
MRAKLPPGTLEQLWNDPANWRARYFYVCRDDPRLVVPKRERWRGWTVNFAHRAAWIYFAVAMGVLIALVYLAFFRGIPELAAVPIILLVVASIIFARWLASPKRFEEGDP